MRTKESITGITVDMMEQNNQPFLKDTLENVLARLYISRENGCLELAYGSIVFFVHFSEGKLVYGTNSLAPFERLERHLRRLSNQNHNLTNNVIKQPRLKFKNHLRCYSQIPSDYEGILWLSQNEYIDPQEAVTLLRRITREVFEALLCLSDPCQYRFTLRTEPLAELCKFDTIAYIEQCHKRLMSWQAFADLICSPYQRPYLVTQSTNTIANLTTRQNETICKLLKGLNFRQIGALIDRDELVVAKILYPSIVDKNIIIIEPKPPFDRLPKLPEAQIKNNLINQNWSSNQNDSQVNPSSEETLYVVEKNYKFACVDDSQAVQNNIQKFLDNKFFGVLSILDSMNAFAELIEFQPDLILLDGDMPDVNGYELCNLLRNHQDFKTTPIIMMNEEEGLINLTKVKLANATDSLIKPFSKKDLFDVVFKYIN